MKNRILTIKSGARQTRLIRLVCLVLSIVLVLGTNVMSFADTAPENLGQGYEWTRVRSNADIDKWLQNVADIENKKIGNDKTKQKVTVDSLKGDNNYTNDNSWIRALIIYNDKYYVDGYRVNSNGSYYLARVDENEKFQGAAYSAISGIDPYKDTFQTRSGLNTPFIKFRGWDGDNSCYKFALRVAKDDALSKTILIENINWYGVAWHAALYSEFRFCECNNITTYEYTMACSSDYMTDFSMDFYSFEEDVKINNVGSATLPQYAKDMQKYDGLATIFYNIPNGLADRYWAHNGGQTIASEKYGYMGDSGYKIYLGYPTTVAVETMDAALEVGETVVWDGKIVGRDTVITVKQGSTLVIDGKCYNDGKIVVDGGTLIVKGVLDMDIFDSEPKQHAFSPGTIEVKNGGLLLIEKSGCLLQRSSNSTVTVTDNSTMIVNGSAAIAKNLTVSNYSRFESSYGCFVGFGLKPSTTIEQTKYTANSIKDYSYLYGSDLFSSALSSIGQNVLSVSKNSAAYMNGGFFAASFSSVTSDETSKIYGNRSYNLNASVGSMVDY